MARKIIVDMVYTNSEGNEERELLIGYYNISHGETLRYVSEIKSSTVIKETLDWIKIREEKYEGVK